MGHVKYDRPVKQAGNTTFCPFNNGNSCSKSCALYDAKRYPVCGMAPHMEKPEVNVEYSTEMGKIETALEEIVLQLIDLNDALKGDDPVEEAEEAKKKRPEMSRADVVQEWLQQCSPFDIANQTTGKVHEIYTAWCNRNGHSNQYTQKGLTEAVTAKTGAVVVPGHGRGNGRFETTPEFMGWSQRRISNG